MQHVGNGACFECDGWGHVECPHCAGTGAGLFDWAKKASSAIRNVFSGNTPAPAAAPAAAVPSPPEKVCFEASSRAYDNGEVAPITGWPLVLDQPTLKVFRDGSGMRRLLVAVRGTVPTDIGDLKADASIAIGRLESSDRFKRDGQIFNGLTVSYPPSDWAYFVTGHSLGSAVGLALQRRFPFIQGAVYYNGALQPQDLLSQNPRSKEMYISKDPLYRIAGHFWRNKQVLAPTQGTGKDSFLPDISDALMAHKLTQFNELYGAAFKKGKNRLARHNDTVERGVHGITRSEHAWVEAAMARPLSDAELRTLLGPDIRIITYPELAGVTHIDSLLDDKGRLVILFLTTSKSAGHWTAVLETAPGELEFFDPYGLPPDGDFKFVTEEQKAAVGERPVLASLLGRARQSGWKVRHNPYQFQAMHRGVNSCGRWVTARLLHHDLSIHEFKDLVDRSGVAPDVFVTVTTENSLRGTSATN